MVEAALRVELTVGEGVLVLAEVAVDHLTEGIVMVAGLLLALVVGEGRDAAEAVVGIEELAAFRTVLVGLVVALGNGVFLLGNDPAVGPVIGGDLLGILAADLLQHLQTIIEVTGDVVLAGALEGPAVDGIVAVFGDLALRVGKANQEVIGVVLVLFAAGAILFIDPVAVGIVGIADIAGLQQLVGGVITVAGAVITYLELYQFLHRENRGLSPVVLSSRY